MMTHSNIYALLACLQAGYMLEIDKGLIAGMAMMLYLMLAGDV